MASEQRREISASPILSESPLSDHADCSEVLLLAVLWDGPTSGCPREPPFAMLWIRRLASRRFCTDDIDARVELLRGATAGFASDMSVGTAVQSLALQSIEYVEACDLPS